MRALVRPVPASFSRSLCLSPPASPIDVERARAQHERYRAELARHVEQILELDGDEDYPDCCFVEDTAVVIGARALVTRPGAASRQGEPQATHEALQAAGLSCTAMAAPAALDGGDVLVSGRNIFVGISQRTNRAALGDLRRAFPEHALVPVPVDAGLHLKSAVTRVTERHFLVEDSPCGRQIFAAVAAAEPHASPIWVEEPHAANALRVGDAILHLAGRPALAAALSPLGLELVPLDMSELEKADGGLTCLSILVP